MAKRNGEDGIAVLLSLFYALLVLGLVLTTISGRRLSDSHRGSILLHESELRHLTEAGLIHALHEIRKSKTLDRVEHREWALSHSMGGLLWGTVDVMLDSERRLLIAKAEIHERSDPLQGLSVYPNKLLARGSARVRLGRIRFRPPAKAPLVLGRPDRLQLGADLTLLTRQGEATLAYVAQGEEAPELPPDALAMEISGERLELVQLLGIRAEDLAVMADRTVPAGEAFQEMQWGFTHLSGAHRFGSDTPLRGNGLLVVDGDLSLEGEVSHEFHGILLVMGDLKVRGKARVEGLTIVLGALQVLSEGVESGLTLQFDEECLRRSLWSVEGVRFSERTELLLESVTEVQPTETER